MATRATYEIAGQVFYCHYDGYPAGGVGRLRNMLNAPGRGGAAFDFIRGNPDAEPAESHEVHADTEYRYIHYRTPTESTLQIYARCFSSGKFYPIYNGGLAAAVNLFTPEPEERFWNSPQHTGILLSYDRLEEFQQRFYLDDDFVMANKYRAAMECCADGTGTRAAHDEIQFNINNQLIDLNGFPLYGSIHHPDTAAAAAAAE